jgi:hypothetical protein
MKKLKLIQGDQLYTADFPDAETWQQAMRMKVNEMCGKINEIIDAIEEMESRSSRESSGWNG